jgi:lipopolysaccharide export system protein LptC
MSLGRYLRDRSLLAGTLVIALLAGGGQLVLWWIGPASAPNDFVGPPRSGYTLIDSHVTEYDVTGRQSMRLQSPHIERREGDESLYLNAPTFQLPPKIPSLPDWDGKSLYGWVNKDGTLLKLQGPVYMHRPAYVDTKGVAQAQTIMHTSEVTAWPKDQRMETAEPANIVQGPRTISGIGMRASLTQNHLELLDASHIIFPPRTPKPSAGQPAASKSARAAAGDGAKG